MNESVASPAPEPTLPPSSPRRARVVAEPFQGFFEREQLRKERGRYTRKILVASIALHVVVFALLGAWAYWRVDELFGPSVEVKVYGARSPKLPRTLTVTPPASR